jgi:hypothetical protein
VSDLSDLQHGRRASINSDRRSNEQRALLRRLRELAERQDGPIERGQLLSAGLTTGSLHRWIDRGLLIRLHPRVYVLGHTVLTERGRLRAALLYAGPDSLLSHRTAAHLLGLVDRASSIIHVATSRQVRSLPGVLVHRPNEIDGTLAYSLPITTPARTLVDVAPDCADWELRKALSRADFKGLITALEVNAAMGRGRPGASRLRAAIARHMPELAHTLSVLEDRLLLMCERFAIPLPSVNARIGSFIVDFLWQDEMLVVEVDGGAAHSSSSQRRRDAERDMELRRRGYLVLRYTWWQVTKRPEAVAAEIRLALADRRGRAAN